MTHILSIWVGTTVMAPISTMVQKLPPPHPRRCGRKGFCTWVQQRHNIGFFGAKCRRCTTAPAVMMMNDTIRLHAHTTHNTRMHSILALPSMRRA